MNNGGLYYRRNSSIHVCAECGHKFIPWWTVYPLNEQNGESWHPIDGDPITILCEECYQRSLAELYDKFSIYEGGKIYGKKTSMQV